MHTASILMLLLASVSALALLAQRLSLPYPILLVLGGLVIGFIPGLPKVQLDPQLVLLIFLPPLLYAQAWVTSWREFLRWRRAIFLLAFGAVLFTASAVAFAAHLLIGLPLPVGFVLGAIVSPPDAVAAATIMQRLRLPRRLVMILEGESLVNDATGLVLYKFGIAAVLTGTFSLAQASVQFVLVVVVGIGIGLLVARASAMVFKCVKDTGVLITFSMLVPYLAYISAEALHASGVLAAVATGLYLGWKDPQLLSAATRLQAIAVWTTLVFLLNSIIFLLIGLQLPVIWAGLSGYSTGTLLGYGAAICLVVVVVRPLWVFPGAYLPRWLSRKVRESETSPTPGMVWVVSYSGMRGVVSLAAAMALPVATAQGAAFPYRDLIIFLTFAVILGTLVGQGLTLAPLIRWLAVPAEPAEQLHKLESDMRLELVRAARLHIKRMAEQKRFPERTLVAVSALYDGRLARLEPSPPGDGDMQRDLATELELRREAIAAARRRLRELQWEDQINIEMMHQLQHELDLEEERLA